MRILVLNGSPKGKNSTTVHTVLYLQVLHREHQFEILHVGLQIRRLEQDFHAAEQALRRADLILFCYPVYTFLAPYQIHRFIELIREHAVPLEGKFASQITTSKHFYDVTAHRYIEENCFDLGMKVIRGLSADMDDLLTEQGRKDARMYFDQLMFSCAHGLSVTPPVLPPERKKEIYRPRIAPVPKKPGKRAVIVTNCEKEDENLAGMIGDFQAAFPYESRVVNLLDFPFAGGCLGCFNCAVDGTCVYKDGFDRFLRQEIQTADAIVYAFTIAGHFTGSVFKCYDDRQFCNGHRTVTRGIPAAYLISGDYRFEANLQTVIEARCDVGGTYLCGVATDEGDTAASLRAVAENLAHAMDHHLSRPAGFYGVGGMKIFRDLIYVMRGLMKADHQFYRKNGIYDFPQKQKKRIFQMKMVGGMMAVPAVRKKMKGQITDYIILPYRKVVEQAEKGKA